MSRRVRTSAASLVAGLALMIGLLSPAIAVAADDSVTFERPSAEASNFTVRWTQVFRAPTPPVRVELMTRLVGQEAWLVNEVPLDDLEGRDRYGAAFIVASTSLPNTRIEGRFRVTPEDGPPETGPAAMVKVEDDRIDWRTLEGDLVRLHWHAGGKAFAERALRIAEDSIAATSQLLGVKETEPIDFFIYADPDQFQSALGPGTKEFVAGRAIPEIRTLFGRILPDQIGSDWVPLVIGHELAHLVFDTATANPYHEPPHWLNEGLATYLTDGYSDEWRQRVSNAIERDTLLPLTSITDGFPSAREDLFYLGYGEGASAIDFFVRTYGQEKLVQLIRSYGAGVTDDEAFGAATGEGFEAFEAAWLSDLGAAEPDAHGPQDAKPGSTPIAWVGGARPAPTDTDGPGGVPPGEPDPNSSGNSSSSGIPPPGTVAALLLAGGLSVFGVVVLRRRRAPVGASSPNPGTLPPSPPTTEPPPPASTDEP